MARVLYEWEAFGQRLRLSEHDAANPGWERLSALDARWAVSGLLQDPVALGTLRAWLVARSGGLHRPGADDRRMVEVEVDRGALFVLAQPVERTALQGGFGRPAESELRRPEPRSERAWVDILVIDDGEPARPLAGVGYRLTLPDRSVRTDALGGDGRVHEQHIDPGQCRIELDDVRLTDLRPGALHEMAPERSIVHVHLRPDGTVERASALTDQPTTVVVRRPRLPATVLPWGRFLPGSVLSLPRAHEPHPWAPVLSLLRFLQDHLDHGALFVGHREASEPAELAELRARALLHFLRDEQLEWVDLASAHGRVQDTQAFLQYLAQARGWDTGVPALSDRPDAQTARAVEAFQRTYNLAFRADIHEDGIIGEQTLGAIFEVAKAEFVHWAELNGTSLDALRFFSSERPTIGAAPEFGGRPFVQLLAIPSADRYDLEFEPPGAGIFRVARLIPLPAEEIAAPAFNVLKLRLIDEWGEPLRRRAYELTVNGDTRFGETDEHGMLAEPFLPAGAVTLRLGDGAPVLFHDLYEPRQPSQPEARDDDLAELHGDGAEDEDDDVLDDDDDDDDDDHDDDDAPGWDHLAAGPHAPD